MNKAMVERLAAVEVAIRREAQARRGKAAADRFRRVLSDISKQTGIDLVGGAFPRQNGLPPGPGVRQGPRTVKERVADLLREARAFVEAHQTRKAAGEADTGPVGEPVSTEPSREPPQPAEAAHAGRSEPDHVPAPPAPPGTPPSSTATPVNWVRLPADGFRGGAGRFMGVGG